MASLTACIRKAAKNISKGDAATIRELYADYQADGLSTEEAAKRALADYLDSLEEEKASLIEKAEKAGGDVSKYRQKIKLSLPDKNVEIARELSIIENLYEGKPLPGLDKKKNNARSFAKYLSRRARKANRGKPLSATTPRNKDIISEVLYLETVEAMKQSGHAGTWYSDTLKEAMAVAGILHPEINSDPIARSAFVFAMAVTSNGATVTENTDHAEEVYAYYKRNKRMPDKGFGPTAGAMRKAFRLYNALESKWGKAALTDFMHTEFTVAELGLLGLSVSGENQETNVYGSAVFGPKVGQGFYQNLSGNYTPLTMDRWWMRTWGRMVGNLAPEGMSAAQQQAVKLREILPKHQTKIEGMGYAVEELMESDAKLSAMARRVHTEYARGGYKEKTDLNKAAKNFDNALHDPVVSPRNGSERAWIREVATEALNKLNARGFTVDMASMQALLWYPEKEFYLKNGVGNEKAKPTDYSKEFQRLAASRGIDQPRIESAIAGARAGQPTRAARAGGPQPGRPVKGTRGLAAKARQRLLVEAAARELRGYEKAAFRGRVPKGDQRSVAGASAVNVHAPATRVKNVLEKAGLGAPAYLELAPSVDGAAVFTSAAKAAGIRARELSPAKLELARPFMTEDGLAGFALDGDEIVAVFKNKKSEHRGLSQSMVRLAVEQGGRWMRTNDRDAHLFAAQGMRPAAKVADEIFLVYDRTLEQPYESIPVESVGSVAEAEQIVKDLVYDLEPRNYPDRSLRFRLEDEPNPIVDQQPDNPLSQITKIAATVEDQMANGPTSGRTLRQAIVDAGLGKNAKNLEHLLGAIPRRNLRDFVAKEAMPSVDGYVRLANRMDGRRNELLLKQEKIGKRWGTYVSKNKSAARVLGELMHAATIAGVDPATPYKPLKAAEKMNEEDRALDAKRKADHRILKKWWDTLDSEGKAVYEEVRDSYIEQRRHIEKALMDRIAASDADTKTKNKLMNEMRKKFETGRVAGPYFPLARFGELWAAAKDADGNTIAFSRFEKVSEQREWIKNFRAAGYVVDSGKKQDDQAIMGRLDPGFVARVTELADKTDPGLADEIWQMYLKSLPEMSMRKAFLHRKNRLGFTTDAIRSFGHNMFHGSHQLAKLEFMHLLDTKLDQMKEEARIMEQQEDPDALWGNAVYREMTRRHEWARNPRASLMATKLTSLGFAWYLGTTPAAATVNLTQTAIVGLPVLSAQFGWARSSTELARAAALYAGSWGPMANRLRGDERLAMDEAQRIGLFDKTQAHDLAGVSEEGVDYNSLRHKTMQIVSWMFHKAEEFNRQVTFLAAYRLGRKKGMTHNDAVLQAEDMTWDAHFDYNNVNRPRYLQGDMAKVILLFRQYSLNMTYRLARDFNDSMRGASPEVRKAARTRFAGILAQTGLFAGATGLPMYWVVEAVMNALMGDEDEPYDFTDDTRAFLAQTFSPRVAEIIMKGAFDNLTGATLSARVSLNNLWLRDAPANLEGQDLWMHYVGELVGPIPSIARDVGFKAPYELSEGNYDRALENALPKFLRDYAKTYRYMQEGVQTRRGDVVFSKEEMTDYERFLQAVGFVPARLTAQYEQNRAVKEAERKLLRRKAKLLDRLFLAVRNDDKQMLRENMKSIAEFNKANPSLAIDASGVISSARSRAEYSFWARGGVTVNRRLQYLHEKKRFLEKKGEPND